MGLQSLLLPYAAQWLTSGARVSLARRLAKMRRGAGPREVHYFHRVDDPICQLMVQILPEFAERFDIRIRPHVVEKLDARFFPDPHRYEALAVLDAIRLAGLLGLGFPREALVPDRLAVGMAARHLAALEGEAQFFEAAEAVGEALWRYDLKAVRGLAGMADMGDAHMRDNERLLKRMGHWASGTLAYEGEVYPGLDRIDHLETRLNAEGAGDGEERYGLHRNLMAQLGGDMEALRGKTLELFLSPRSPYSYLALEQASRLAARSGLDLVLRPVMPMVARGQPLPALKKQYLVFDAGREARRAGIAFGRFADPVDAPSEKAMAYVFAAQDDGDDHAFLRAWMQSTWSLGNNGNSTKGFAAILARAGLAGRHVRPLEDSVWRRAADANHNAMLTAGSWGVPTFRAAGQTFWGQDRLWAALQALTGAE